MISQAHNTYIKNGLYSYFRITKPEKVNYNTAKVKLLIEWKMGISFYGNKDKEINCLWRTCNTTRLSPFLRLPVVDTSKISLSFGPYRCKFLFSRRSVLGGYAIWLLPCLVERLLIAFKLSRLWSLGKEATFLVFLCVCILFSIWP